MSIHIRTSVPASSANLGPGYDILGLALDLRLKATASPANEWSVVPEGGPDQADELERLSRNELVLLEQTAPSDFRSTRILKVRSKIAEAEQLRAARDRTEGGD